MSNDDDSDHDSVTSLSSSDSDDEDYEVFTDATALMHKVLYLTFQEGIRIFGPDLVDDGKPR